jgi:hypothetical protein
LTIGKEVTIKGLCTGLLMDVNPVDTILINKNKNLHNMKNKSFSITLILTCSVFLFSCSKDNEDDQDPGGGGGGGGNNCVTTNMKYATDIQPILQANCYSCHQNGQNGGVNLGSHAGVKVVADNGRLVGAITHAAGFAPMPQGLAKLSDCNINKIKSWVTAGAPNN